jgi:hypothetical protein
MSAGDLDALSTAAFARILQGHPTRELESWLAATAQEAGLPSTSLTIAAAEAERGSVSPPPQKQQRYLHASLHFVSAHFPQLLGVLLAFFSQVTLGRAQESSETVEADPAETETVDLASLEGERPPLFTPELGARHPAWIGLPVLMLLLLLLHLRRPKTRKVN